MIDEPMPVRRGSARSPVLGRLRTVPGRIPLRITLVVALLVLVTVALVATSVAVTAALRGYLVSKVDEDLTRGGGGRGALLDLQRRAPDGACDFRRARQEYLGAVLPDGQVVGLRQVIAGGDEPRLPSSLPADLDPFTLPSAADGPDWRAVARPGRMAGTPVTFVRAISLSEVDDAVSRLVLVEVVAGLVVLVLLGGIGYLVVRSSLRPLAEVENTAAAIAGGDLSRRVPDRDPRTEVGRLSRALNGMLAQIEVAFSARAASESAALASEERMRRFVADASHELRTPLTSIRGFAELYRQGAVDEQGGVDRVMRRVEDEAARMGLLVDDLLLLARLDQQRPLERTPVDLVAIATEAVHDAGTLAPDRSVGLEVLDGEAPVVVGDEARLRQVVGNLVSNALTHTPAQGPVTITVGTSRSDDPDGRQALLSVSDSGPGLSAVDADRVFERFYRADPARTRRAGGSGLGLSIVAALVAAHGGTVAVDTAPGRGSTFQVRLPLLLPDPTS